MAEGTRQREAFDRYWRLGDERSIERLRATLAADGRARCLRTLYEWSRRYRWQERLAELEREAQRVDRKRQLRELREMNERHAKEGVLLQQKGVEGLMALDASQMTATAAERAIVAGADLERKARGLGPNGRRREAAAEVKEVREVHLHLGGSQEAYMFPVPEDV